MTSSQQTATEATDQPIVGGLEEKSKKAMRRLATATEATDQPIVGGSEEKSKKAMRRLAIAEVLLGSISMLCGILVYVALPQSFYIADGVWCGAIIVAPGGLGIAATGNKSSRDLVNCHVGFSILAVVFSAILCCNSILRTILLSTLSQGGGVAVAIYGILSISSFFAFVVLIMSASYCCCTSNGCCTSNECCNSGGCCQSNTQTSTAGEVVDVSPSNQQTKGGAAAQGYERL